MIIIGPSFLELNSDDFPFFKNLSSSSRSRTPTGVGVPKQYPNMDLELHLDGAEKCPAHISPLLGLCFGPLSSLQVDFFAQYGIL